MKYTKENFIKGEFAFINDGSKELENVLKEWFPDDKTLAKDYPQEFIVRNQNYCDRWDTSSRSNGTEIKASELNKHKEWNGSEMEFFNGNTWHTCAYSRYRLKQFPDHTEEIQRLAKEMNVTVKINLL